MNSFISSDDVLLTERFLRDGYIIQRAEQQLSLNLLREIVAPFEPSDSAALNDLKLEVMARLNTHPTTRRAYYNLAKELLHSLIGNELAMQKKFNVNIQMPQDAKSLLPVHADTWTGDSPYQLVLWVPLTDCYRTKSMYILPPGEPYSLEGSSEDVWERIKGRVQFLDVKYGEVLLFNPTLPHGNRVNEESSTRWTINCRFKSVWSPYAVKGAGEHFEPITLRAASRIGMAYKHPEITKRYEIEAKDVSGYIT